MHYTVKQVSTLTGVAPDTLRAWERRYGVVAPGRTEGGYRLYDEHDVARLQMMARLVADGTPASLAAQQVESSRAAAPPPEPVRAGPPVDLDPDALVVAARELDRAAVEAVLDRALAFGSFESVAEQWLLPALRAVGEAWAEGRIDVAGEHLVSGALRDRLGRAFDAAGSALGGPVVVVGMPPGSLHELGTLTFATCLRRLGADVRWLGADLPVESWAHASRRLDPSAAVIGVPTVSDRPGAAAVAARLREDRPSSLLFVGGAGAQEDPGTTRLPEPVAEAALEVLVRLRKVGRGQAG